MARAAIGDNFMLELGDNIAGVHMIEVDGSGRRPTSKEVGRRGLVV
jgi:hypothetical protein